MKLLGLLLNAYSLLLFVSVILSWVRLPEDHPVVRVTTALTEPVLGPIRRVVPAPGGIDFSAMIALFLLSVLRRFLHL